MSIKDTFEMLIKIFNGDGTQFVKDASYLDAIVGMRVASIAGRNQQPIGSLSHSSRRSGVL